MNISRLLIGTYAYITAPFGGVIHGSNPCAVAILGFPRKPALVIRNLDFARKAIGGIPSEKRVDLETACAAFVERQRRENRNRRTIYSDAQALRYFCQFAGWKLPLIELTEARINEYFDTMNPRWTGELSTAG
jgi:hypothetical protein